jgi:hypothetical protein
MVVTSDMVDLAVNAIENWLLSDAVIRGEAPGGGGIISWLEPDGRVDGLYPEIAGYHLQFLALVSAPSEDTARDAARRVIAWLDAAGPRGDPLTLYWRQVPDWRNACLFAFDLAIICRGLLSVRRRWPDLMPATLLARYVRSLTAITADGVLSSHRLRHDSEPVKIPEKWSTLIGVHHVKAAAALAGADESGARALAQATAAFHGERFDRLGRCLMVELHPFLYSVEGWLTLWADQTSDIFLQRARKSFDSVLAEIDPQTGLLPALLNEPQIPARTDILAQALRVGLVLEAAAAIDPLVWGQRRISLLRAVLTRVADGGVLFDEVGRHLNAWVSLFTWQALRFWQQARSGTLVARQAAALII